MKYALVNGILLDGTEAMQPRSGLTVLLKGDRIEAIVPAGTEPPDYEKIDLSGGYVMPGLINLHVHLPASGKPTVKQKDPQKGPPPCGPGHRPGQGLPEPQGQENRKSPARAG